MKPDTETQRAVCAAVRHADSKVSGENPLNYWIDAFLSKLEERGLTIAPATQVETKPNSLRVAMVFDDWREKGKSIYNTEPGNELSRMDFHRGTVFEGYIEFDQSKYELGDARDLLEAIRAGFQPVFWLALPA